MKCIMGEDTICVNNVVGDCQGVPEPEINPNGGQICWGITQDKP